MTREIRMEPNDSAPAAERPPRKPYEAPKVVSREVLEAMAAICAPSPPAKSNPGLCPRGPINS